MKKRVILILTTAVILASTTSFFTVDAQAKGKIHEVTFDNYTRYCNVISPDSFLGMKATYRGVEDGTGTIAVQYGEKGNSAVLYACGENSAASAIYADNLWGSATGEHDVIDLRDFLGKEKLSTDVPTQGKKILSYAMAVSTEKESGLYKAVEWHVTDFTECKDEDVDYGWEDKGYPVWSYALVFDDSITEDQFETVYEFINQVDYMIGG